MNRKRIVWISGAVLSVLMVFGLTRPVWAHKNNTVAFISFSSNPAVTGTPVTITGTVLYDGTQANGTSNNHLSYPINGAPIMAGSIQIEELQLNGYAVACGTIAAAYVNIAQGAPNASGKFSTVFSTTGLAGQTIGFRTHHPDSGGQHGDSESKSDCYNLQIIMALDPFPDAMSYTQGFYGASPIGEAVVADLMDGITCDRINYILAQAGVQGTPYDCYTALPVFLTGTVGPGNDSGFLPSGFVPGQNMAAQMITLLLNLNLANVLPNDASPIYGSFYINIDALEDLFGDPPASSVPPTYVDPILNISELGSCSDINTDFVCDAGTIILTALGHKVTDLDTAGTTVQDIFDGAYSLLTSGASTVVMNGVMLTKGELTQILGLINESYDEGVPTGFVAAFDAD